MKRFTLLTVLLLAMIVGQAYAQVGNVKSVEVVNTPDYPVPVVNLEELNVNVVNQEPLPVSITNAFFSFITKPCLYRIVKYIFNNSFQLILIPDQIIKTFTHPKLPLPVQ